MGKKGKHKGERHMRQKQMREGHRRRKKRCGLRRVRQCVEEKINRMTERGVKYKHFRLNQKQKTKL